MSFTQSNPCVSTFCFDHQSYPLYPPSQLPFPCALSEAQYRMYLLYEQSRSFQHQLMQQKYN